MPARLLIRLLACAACVALVVTGFNVVVNPYGIWPAVLGQDFLREKPARVNSVRMVKAYDLLRGCPDHVVTGMSSVVWGVDPETYPVKGKRLYNGGLVGSSMIEQYHYVMSFLEQCPNISRVYIDVNYEMFHTLRINAKDFSNERLGRRLPTTADAVFATFSRTSLISSWETVAYHADRSILQRVWDRGDGFHRIPEAASDAYRANFDMYLKGVYRTNRALDEKQLAYFRDLVESLRARGVEVIPYFAPIHTSLHYMRRFDSPAGPGSAKLQDDLRRTIADVTPFWDFSLSNEWNGEPIEQATYFIDQIHYRPKTGRIVMEVLNGLRPPEVPQNFGVLVNREDLDAHLHRFVASVDAWAARYPAYAERIRSAYAKAPEVTTEQLRQMNPDGAVGFAIAR